MRVNVYICGNCFHWVESDAVVGQIIGATHRGTCYGAPPGVAVRFHGNQVAGQANVRPATLATERACGAFVPRDALQPAANDDKVN